VEAAASAEERARLWDGYFDNASGLNELMEVWVADLAFTADALSGPDAPPEWIRLSPAVRSGQVGVMGMSFGGGAVAEFCKADARCAAGLNLDGGPYGLRRDEPLQIPYLVMSSPANDGSNAALMQASRADFYDASVAGAAHADFMDLTLIAPVMKWTGANGPIEGNRMIDVTNAVALAFFDAYLRDGPEPQLDAAAFPELTVTAKAGPDG
jgi:dienelactone hydrolase